MGKPEALKGGNRKHTLRMESSNSNEYHYGEK